MPARRALVAPLFALSLFFSVAIAGQEVTDAQKAEADRLTERARRLGGLQRVEDNFDAWNELHREFARAIANGNPIVERIWNDLKKELEHKPGGDPGRPAPGQPPANVPENRPPGVQQPAPAPGVGPPASGQPTSAREAPPDRGRPQEPWVRELRRWHWDQERRQNPDDPAPWVQLGFVEFERGNYAGSQRHFDEAFSRGYISKEALTVYGRTVAQQGDYRLARQAFGMALQMDPKDITLRDMYHLSANRASTIQLPSALDKVGLGQDGGAGSSGSGEAHASAGVHVAAPSAVSAAQLAAIASQKSQMPPDRVRQSAGVTREVQKAMTIGDWQAAKKLASHAIELNPNNAQAWNLRAIAETRLAAFPAAVHDASYALQLAPGNATALQTRSWAFAKQGLYKEALADANYTIEREPGNAYAFFNKAFAEAGMGNKERAVDALKQAARLDQRFQGALEEALRAPQESDLLFLFQDGPAAKVTAAAPLSRDARKKRFLRLVVFVIIGGLLVALGILHIVSASWREKVRATIRRVLGAPAGGGAAGAELPGARPVSGFWEQYEVVKGIGSGGMGLVYEGRDRSLDRPVAIKKMRDEIRADPAERQRFLAEAKAVASLHHPNIVDIYAVVEDDQDIYLVFEFVSGQTLSDRLREKGPMSFEAARHVLKGVCDAIDHAHRHKMIHRDIKPSNVMITEDGLVKVMDFGVARQAKDALTKMSMTNTIAGTPPYMAPEQEQGGVRRESDIFAAGVLFYELLSGDLPFLGVGAGMLLNKINGKHAPISDKVKGLPDGLDQVFARALHPDPEKRFRSAGELYAAVEALSVPAAG